MSCECAAADGCIVDFGDGCTTLITVVSRCERAILVAQEESFIERKEQKPYTRSEPVAVAELEATLAVISLPAEMCKVTYIIDNDRRSVGSITEFSAGGIKVRPPNPIAPGRALRVTTRRRGPTQCRKEKIGKVTVLCPDGTEMTEDGIEVCVAFSPAV